MLRFCRNGHFRIRENDVERIEGVLDVVILVRGLFDTLVINICESSSSPQ